MKTKIVNKTGESIAQHAMTPALVCDKVLQDSCDEFLACLDQGSASGLECEGGKGLHSSDYSAGIKGSAIQLTPDTVHLWWPFEGVKIYDGSNGPRTSTYRPRILTTRTDQNRRRHSELRVLG